ncbi:TPA: hypothetical protein ACGUTL_004490 [Vibrio vulnificus]
MMVSGVCFPANTTINKGTVILVFTFSEDKSVTLTLKNFIRSIYRGFYQDEAHNARLSGEQRNAMLPQTI